MQHWYNALKCYSFEARRRLDHLCSS